MHIYISKVALGSRERARETPASGAGCMPCKLPLSEREKEKERERKKEHTSIRRRQHALQAATQLTPHRPHDSLPQLPIKLHQCPPPDSLSLLRPSRRTPPPLPPLLPPPPRDCAGWQGCAAGGLPRILLSAKRQHALSVSGEHSASSAARQ